MLEKISFKKLKELYLDNNRISNIKVLEIINFDNFKNLKYLDLHNNMIDYYKYSNTIEMIKSKVKNFSYGSYVIK